MNNNSITQQSNKPFNLQDKAPNFCTQAYRQGEEFQVCLQDYVGKWLLIIFYSSDFSFV